MGVKKFYDVVVNKPLKTLEDYRGKTLAIDGNLMIYKNILGIRKSGYDIINNGKSITHILSMYNKLKKFKEYGIKAVFVFDGTPPQLKLATLKNRDVIRDTMKKKYTSAKSKTDKKKYFYLGADITDNEIKESIELIKIFGYGVIYAKTEADTVLAKLSQMSMVDAVVTDDADILIYGGKVLLKNFTTNTKKKFYQVKLDSIKKSLNFNQDQIILLALLLGTDYNVGVKNIGPKKAPALIKKYPTLSDLYKNNIVNINDRDNFTKAFELFKKHYNSRVKPPTIKNNALDKAALKKFLLRHNYTGQKIKMMIQSL